MKISIQKASDILTQYIVEKLIPQASIGGKTKLGFILPIIPTYLMTQMPVGMALGLIDENANVDMMTFEKCAKSSIGVAEKFSIAGFTFTKDDVNSFFSYVIEHTKQTPPSTQTQAN